MSNYKLTEDLKIINTIILPKNGVISFDDDNTIKVTTEYGPMIFTKDSLKDKIEIIEELPEIKVILINEEEEDVIKNYRLQLDVKTTSRKAKEIENYLRRTLQDML